MAKPVFDGDEESGLVQDFRQIVHLDTFSASAAFRKSERDSFTTKVETMKDLLLEELRQEVDLSEEGEMEYSFNVLKSVATENSNIPQVPHLDDYLARPENKKTYLVFVATGPCQVCFVKGTHEFSTLYDMVDLTTFNRPYVCDMVAGERLYLHINTLHCGWGCLTTNYRLFFMLNIKHKLNRIQIVPEDVVA